MSCDRHDNASFWHGKASIVLFPDTTMYTWRGKDLGTLQAFSWSCAPSCGRARGLIQTYANYHMIAELAEPRVGANIPRSFSP